MTRKWLFFCSLPLGVATGFLLDLAVHRLPYTETRDAITDALSLPGGYVSGFFFPEGIHGDHPMGWFWLAVISNQLTYALFWFGVLLLCQRLVRRKRIARPTHAGATRQ
jgi:hypothetical protein